MHYPELRVISDETNLPFVDSYIHFIVCSDITTYTTTSEPTTFLL